jgi:thymidine phosphorylase
VTAPASGYVGTLDAELIGRASVVLGGGRDRVDDTIDPAVAVMIKAPVGAQVRAGDGVLELRYREQRRLEDAWPLVTQAVRITEQPPSLRPLIMGEVR